MTPARFLLDRSVGGRALVSRLREANWDVRTLAEAYGDARAQTMRDEEWISEGTLAGFILVTKDHRVATRPLEAQAIHAAGARVVTFARGDITAATMGDMCLEFAEALHNLARANPPFVISLSRGGLRRKKLYLP